jgi:2-iminobutanoate/2-iminopropanoate deaminase
MMGQPIQPTDLPDWEGQTYSNGYQVGNILWISGQTALADDGYVIGVADPRAQAQRIFERIDKILKAAGGVPQDIVNMRTYVTDTRYLRVVREVREPYFAGHRPCSTGVQVASLARAEFLIEIDATAVIGQSRGGGLV